ncbi:MAG: murein biosynthesis integral membrane protein MurJ [Proteobacteria bacterium]|nr:murein biosynthesis integral membrane protein MurJ [Pseudomonadota bacterium]MBU1451052.1 murein biosynthesis integral membrane protein MurJ [Pseudomonadota bacterium]
MQAASEQHKMTRAAGVVGLATLASRIGGFVRDVVIAYLFGAGPAADAFFVAFRIPNLLRRLFAEGTLTIAFIPVFTETLRKKGREEAFLLARSTLSLLSLALLAVTIAGVVFAPEVVRLIAPGFTPGEGTFALAVEMTRWCLPYIFFISLVALAGGVLNSLGHFFAPAAAPALLNLTIIATALVLSPRVDPPVLSLAMGVVIGGVAQLLMQLPYLKAKGVPFKPAWDIKNPALRRMLRLMIPAIFGAAVYQVAVLVDTILASFLPSGTVSYLYYADRLIQFPLGIFAIAVSTAILPSLSRQAADGDQKALLATMGYGLRLILFITVPAMVGLLVLARPLVVLLFMRGEYTLAMAGETAGAVIGLAAGLWAIAGVRAVVQSFYALKDIKTPVAVAAVCLVIKVGASLALMGPLRQTGLALATSLSGAANLVLLLWLLRRRVGLLGGRRLFKSGLGTCAAATVMGLLVALVAYGPDWGDPSGALWRWARPLAALGVGGASYFAAAKLMRLAELDELWQVFRGRRT